MITGKDIFVLFGAIFVVLGVTGAAISHLTTDTVDVEIVDTERVVQGSGDSQSSKYLVYTTGETFANSDAIWHLKFNSSDFQRDILMNKGNTCTFSVYGFRVPWLSMYRNVYEINCTEKE